MLLRMGVRKGFGRRQGEKSDRMCFSANKKGRRTATLDAPMGNGCWEEGGGVSWGGGRNGAKER